MAGELDVYQSCPCGSGKKLKFCCIAILGEMQRITEMQRHHQYQMAKAALAALDKKDLKEAWSRAWVKSTMALAELSMGEQEGPRRLVQEVLEDIPDHPFATVVNGVLALSEEGYPAAKRAIVAAFRIKEGRNGFLTSHLARSLARLLGEQGHPMAMRRHLALAIMVDGGHENKDLFQDYFAAERDFLVPYPLRDAYVLAPFSGPESLRAQYDEAVELEAMGCFSDAAKAFGGIARQNPDQAWVWWNIGLCHAYAAEDPLAVQAFKAAAANQADPELAADALLLARLLQVPTGAAGVDRLVQEFRVHSVGKLLTRLDQEPGFARRTLDPDEDPGELRAASYFMLDRDPNLAVVDTLTLDDVPKVLGEIVVFDADQEDNTPARAAIGSLGHDRLEQGRRRFIEVAGSEVESGGEPIVTGVIRAETAALTLPCHLPPGMKHAQAENLMRARWERIIGEFWPNTPQESLGGKTPAEAAAVPELNVALRAAVLALDAYCEESEYPLDQAAARERVGLPPVALVDVSPDEELSRYSLLQARRVALDHVTDKQLLAIADRAARIGHATLSERAIREILARPALASSQAGPKVYMSLAKIALRRLRTDEALEWIARGRQEAKSQKQPLEELVIWELEDLMLRVGNPNDPKLAELAATLWNYYRPKLPKLTAMIAGLLNHAQLPGPWNVAESGAPESESFAGAGVGGGGLWTPEAQTSGQPSKLWLPGQE